MNKSRIFAKLVLCLVVFMLVPCILAGNASAAKPGGADAISAKAALEGVNTCFSDKAYSSSWLASELSSKFVLNNGGDESVKLPYDLTSVNDNNLNCKEIMLGWGSSNNGLRGGLLPNDVKNTKNPKTVAKYFAGGSLDGTGGVGYKATVEGSEITGKGQKLTYKVSDSSTCGNSSATPELFLNGTKIDEIIFPVIAKADNGITINQQYDYNVPAPGSKQAYVYRSCGGAEVKIEDEGDGSNPKYRISVVDFEANEGVEPYVYQSTISAKTTKEGAEYKYHDIGSYPAGGAKLKLSAHTQAIDPGTRKEDYANDFTLTWLGGGATTLINGLNKNNRMEYSVSLRNPLKLEYYDLALTRQEVYDLYKYYANDVLHMSIVCKGDTDYEMYESGTEINWKGGDSACRIKNNGNPVPDDLYGVDGSYHFTAKITSANDIATILNSLGDLCDPKLNGVEGCNGNPDGPVGPTDSDGFDCDKLVDEATGGEGIGSMQWALCPGLNNTAYTADWVDNFTQYLLEVDPGMYTGLGEVWGEFMRIANIVMIVFLLIVIFSQLTGRGIDNYGIKKMLPRIVTMAIIANLSIYICQIAVDLSNIAGVGLRNLIGTMGGATGNDASFVTGTLTAIFTTAGTAIPGAVTAIAFGGWAALVVGLLLMVIVIVSALVTLFVMIGAREVIIIFCIVVSPLAMVAFILPNTQHLFKKWYDLFKAALIVFPLCGVMSGVSSMMRHLSDEGALEGLGIGGKLIMLILPFVGFFLLPSLLKQAIAGLGKIGGALTSMGQAAKAGTRAMGSAAMRGAQRTQFAQDLAKKAGFRAERRRAAHLLGKKYEEGDLLAASKKARDAAEKARKDDNVSGFTQRRLDRRADDLADEARLLYEGVQTDNKFKTEASTANEGGVEIGWGMAQNRAVSAKESLEVKLHMDRNATLMRGEMADELEKAADEFSKNQNDEKAYYRLKAAISSAMSRGMNKEMLDEKGALAKLVLSNDGFSGKIADTMASGNNKVMSQFGKTRFKDNGAAGAASINDFRRDSSEYGMEQVISSKGADFAVGMDEDTLAAVAGALTTEQLVKAAAATTNKKELAQIDAALKGRTSVGSGGYQIGLSDLTQLSTDTLNSLDTSLLHKAAGEIYRTKDTDATRQLLDRMNQDTREDLLKRGGGSSYTPPSGSTTTATTTTTPASAPAPTADSASTTAAAAEAGAKAGADAAARVTEAGTRAGADAAAAAAAAAATAGGATTVPGMPVIPTTGSAYTPDILGTSNAMLSDQSRKQFNELKTRMDQLGNNLTNSKNKK